MISTRGRLAGRGLAFNVAASCAVWALVGLAYWLDAALPHATTPHAAAFVQAIVIGVVAAFQWLADRAVTAIQILWQVTVILGQALVRFAHGLATVFSKVYGALDKFYGAVLKPFVQWAWRSVVRLEGWLARTFKPLLKFLEAQRQRILRFYDQYFRPIFETIEAVRNILKVLGAAGLDFAKELERKLANLEARLLLPINMALGLINEARDWINRIVTLDGLLQRVTMIQSQIAYAGDTWRVLFNSRLRPLSHDDLQKLRDANQPTAADDTTKRLGDAVRNESVSFWTPSELDAWRASIERA